MHRSLEMLTARLGHIHESSFYCTLASAMVAAVFLGPTSISAQIYCTPPTAPITVGVTDPQSGDANLPPTSQCGSSRCYCPEGGAVSVTVTPTPCGASGQPSCTVRASVPVVIPGNHDNFEIGLRRSRVFFFKGAPVPGCRWSPTPTCPYISACGFDTGSSPIAWDDATPYLELGGITCDTLADLEGEGIYAVSVYACYGDPANSTFQCAEPGRCEKRLDVPGIDLSVSFLRKKLGCPQSL